MKMLAKALKEVGCRLAPKTLCLPFVLAAAKAKCFKLVNPYIVWYIAGSKYRREYEAAMNNKARIYIAYDGCFDLGHNFQKTVTRGWFYTALYCSGVVHPAIKSEIVNDHKEEFPLDFYLCKLSVTKQEIEEHIKTRWYWYAIYLQLIVMGNLA